VNAPPLALLFALGAASVALAAVDVTERHEPFATKPVEQKELEKKRLPLEGVRAPTDETIEFVTVPLTDTKARLPDVRTKETARIDLAPRVVPVQKPDPSRISTSQSAPAKFEKRFQTPAVAQIQGGMNDASRVTMGKVKPEGKRSVLERINRFIFRRNEPAPATTTAGGANEPVEGSPPSGESSDSP